MTAQEFYDKIVSHLRKQNAKSISFSLCFYRNYDGCHISDEEYHPDLEDNSINKLLDLEICPPSLKERLKDHLPLLLDMQRTHDVLNISSWEEAFKTIAEKFGLIYV